MAKEQSVFALVGNPNCGKSALFNSLTGGHAKVGNYPGVTVEVKEAHLSTPSPWKALDLPGIYSLDARTLDETLTRKVLLDPESPLDLIVAVVDATHLERCLALVLELKELGIPMLLASNMTDLAEQSGLVLNWKKLSEDLKVPIILTVATQGTGREALLSAIDQVKPGLSSLSKNSVEIHSPDAIRERYAEVDWLLKRCLQKKGKPSEWTEKVDRVALHPFFGPILLFVILTAIFESIFTIAQIPMEWIEEGIQFASKWIQLQLGAGPLQSLLTDGILTGVGSVLVFLPQILLLFLVLFFLEDSGYMARAAFLMDRLMSRVGLNGKAFIPLLSSFACAIPGIMAARTIESRRDRLTTILIAPLMACSARLPVYSLLISAFIPHRLFFGWLSLQALVLFALYFSGAFFAVMVGLLFRSTLFRGPKSGFLLELPTYKRPSFRNIGIGLWNQAELFIVKAGSIILIVSVILWFLMSYPHSAYSPSQPLDLTQSYAGQIGKALEPFFKPLGFDWKIALALIPGFTARELMISSLATVYAVSGDASQTRLSQLLAEQWSLATGLSLLVWYVLACQCTSTLAVTRRETGSWLWPLFMLVYMTALAYAASFATYRLALWLGWG